MLPLLPTSNPDGGNHRKRIVETLNAILRGEWNPIPLADGIEEPSDSPTSAQLYIDTADGDLKIKFADGYVATIAADSAAAASAPAVTGYSAVKTAQTTRASTITVADDDHLVLTVTETGWYEIDGYFRFGAGVDGTQGIQFKLNYTGSSSSPSYIYEGVVNGTRFDKTNPALTLTHVNQQSTITTITAGDWLRYKGVINLTTTGVFSVQWSQRASDTDPTVFYPASSLSLRKLA